MACSSCRSSTCTGCSALPYYTQSPVCEEDNCQKIYVNRHSFAMCPSNSWNVPLCGQTSILNVDGVQGISLGSYIWHTNYGYYQITSVNTSAGTVGITNDCTTGNPSPGTQIPACTCFVVTDQPAGTNNNANLFPFVAIDFTAPSDATCIDITVTNANGISIGDTIAIGSGTYFVDAIASTTLITICNQGSGITPGTPVIARDAFGNYVYPIGVIASCCTVLAADVATLQTEMNTAQANIITNAAQIADLTASVLSDSDTATTASITSGNSLTTVPGNIVLSWTNTSATRTMQVIVNYVARAQFTGAAGATNVTYSIKNQVNGGALTELLPASYAQDITPTFRVIKDTTAMSVHTVAAGASLTINAQTSITSNSSTITSNVIGIYVYGMAVAVD
jgi:hypothetical protein